MARNYGISIEIIKESIKKERTAIVSRIIGGVVAQTCFIFAIKMLPISMAQIINNMRPFYVTIMAYVFLNEKLSPMDLVGLFGSFAGVILLIIGKENIGVN